MTIMSLSLDGVITHFEGSPRDLSNVGGGNRSMIGLRLDEAWPDVSLIEAARRTAGQHLDGLALSSEVTQHGVRQFYRYQLTPIHGASDQGTAHGPLTTIGVSIVASNITDITNAEQQLRKANAARAESAAREAAMQEAARLKTEYFTHISHEIRTPVAGIITIAELLLADPQLQLEHKLLVSQALRSGEILLELVGMVLDLRKIESGGLELEHTAFRTADLIQDAQLLSVLVKKKV